MIYDSVWKSNLSLVQTNVCHVPVTASRKLCDIVLFLQNGLLIIKLYPFPTILFDPSHIIMPWIYTATLVDQDCNQVIAFKPGGWGMEDLRHTVIHFHFSALSHEDVKLVLTLCNCNYPLHVILVDPIQLQMVSCRGCNMSFTWFFTRCLKKPTSTDIFFPQFSDVGDLAWNGDMLFRTCLNY